MTKQAPELCGNEPKNNKRNRNKGTVSLKDIELAGRRTCAAKAIVHSSRRSGVVTSSDETNRSGSRVAIKKAAIQEKETEQDS